MDAYRSAWLDDELDLFRDAVRRFVQMEIVPHDARWREQHHVDRELWNKAGAVGLLCTDIPAEYGGALLLGVKAPFIICHGSSKAKAIKNAVGVAIDFAEKDVVRHIGESIINKRKGNE